MATVERAGREQLISADMPQGYSMQRLIGSVVLIASLAIPRTSAAVSKLAVLPSVIDPGASKLTSAVVDQVAGGTVDLLGRYRVIDRDDLNALIDYERQKDLVGCDDVACFSEIAGALDVDELLSIRVARTDTGWRVTAKRLDPRRAAVITRSTQVVDGDERALLAALPRIVRGLFVPAGTFTEWMDLELFRDRLDQEDEAGMFAAQVECRLEGARLQYRAKFASMPFGKFSYETVYGSDAEQYFEASTRLAKEGLAELSLQTCIDLTGAELFQATWTDPPLFGQWHNANSYQEELNRRGRRHYPAKSQGQYDGTTLQVRALFRPADELEWEHVFLVSAEDFEKQDNRHQSEGFKRVEVFRFDGPDGSQLCNATWSRQIGSTDPASLPAQPTPHYRQRGCSTASGSIAVAGMLVLSLLRRRRVRGP